MRLKCFQKRDVSGSSVLLFYQFNMADLELTRIRICQCFCFSVPKQYDLIQILGGISLRSKEIKRVQLNAAV